MTYVTQLTNLGKKSLVFKVKVLLSRTDNRIARKMGLTYQLELTILTRTIERDVIPAKYNAGTFEFSSTNVPVGHKFTVFPRE
jgi:hypothetical protein